MSISVFMSNFRQGLHTTYYERKKNCFFYFYLGETVLYSGEAVSEPLFYNIGESEFAAPIIKNSPGEQKSHPVNL